jgi:hypothetical protein
MATSVADRWPARLEHPCSVGGEQLPQPGRRLAEVGVVGEAEVRGEPRQVSLAVLQPRQRKADAKPVPTGRQRQTTSRPKTRLRWCGELPTSRASPIRPRWRVEPPALPAPGRGRGGRADAAGQRRRLLADGDRVTDQPRRALVQLDVAADPRRPDQAPVGEIDVRGRRHGP